MVRAACAGGKFERFAALEFHGTPSDAAVARGGGVRHPDGRRK